MILFAINLAMTNSQTARFYWCAENKNEGYCTITASSLTILYLFYVNCR